MRRLISKSLDPSNNVLISEFAKVGMCLYFLILCNCLQEHHHHIRSCNWQPRGRELHCF
ncbi:hypothetical protein HanRHA438_Chr17g0813401 [Helianthus annuus]|nr:hypothetical protein HanHA89_Chr17g0706881 [Helianthus annuus]KAJ0632478.1 hypothetical protein HanLR1_Chr17g0665571 [Helianthus annuus]KAJ0636319.1 hypothetical protein HanOQP8_Chr17g0660601 [Helianthus annuus]KAJ0813202.1 hypothetical protein HanPSC8_Chr17g0770741 [Helianthus annuus]KAJ0826356.1 hypothetical protein HanRHA438_Chr17g0813401 [Helianthus annuus]